jgi:hypothetical protein
MKWWQAVLSVIGALMVIVLIGLFGFGMDSFFRPAYRQLDNKVFKQSEQYNDGMVRDLENLRLDYIKSDAEGKAALKGIILHRFSVYPTEKLPYELQSFYLSLKGN